MSAHGLKMPVCERRQVIFVRGFKAGLARAILNVSNISSSMLDYADLATSNALKNWFQVKQVKIISNNSPMMSLKEGSLPVSESVVENIHSEVYKAMNRCKCDKIHIIIVAHSHGAKCVNEAFRSFRKSPGDLGQIFRSVSIITLGAIELVKRGDVKLAWNYVFKNDNVANKFLARDENKDNANVSLVGPFEKAQGNACKCCLGHVPKTDKVDWENFELKNGNVVQDTAAITSVAIGEPSKFVKAHYVTDYILCKKLQQDLVGLFHIER